MSDPVSHSSSGSSEGPAAGPSSTGSSNGSSGGSTSGAGQSRSAARADARGGLFDRLRHLIGGWRSTGSLRDDLAEALSTSMDTGSDLTATERSMLKSILDLRELRIGDVMVPRADIIAVQKDITLGELLAVFADAGHSRLVVYDDTLDDPVGMVHIRDLVTYLTQRAMMPRRGEARSDARNEAKSETKSDNGRANGEGAKERPHMRGWDLAHPLPAFNLKAIDLSATLSAAKLIRRLLFVPPSMPSIELLASMQASRIHLALVVDEYGGTDGIVSMEDLVEEIVGDIEDEHDDDETPLIARQADGSFIADARASLEDVAEMIDPAFAAGEEAEEVDTLGGLLVTIAGRVPVRGEIVPGPGQFEIEVLDADPRRVKRLRISRAGEGDTPVRRASAQSEETVREDPARSGAASLPPPAEQASGRRPSPSGTPNEAA
ncbi:CBS domain containing-hemolysin-like protein [Angulomicrobium tetraedrale]|uniref:CBS domain containing-hemolysin-like protein n=1 Tax=Ancylobacter tetraedralis TaxID=217068 RepID=A0A839Z8L3_9HYPH|nr:hemolysin family protein [Ancylobacter tetraedralis]MBB3770718.1 CBS domain containing-hemolysin-like protein [Ancylobacter tetraedralis]